jgi:ABC-2 type transport system permease protein
MSALAQARVQPGASLWRTVGKLLRLRVVILLGGLRRGNLRSRIGTIILGILALTIMAGAFVFSWVLLRLMRSPELAQYVDTTAFLELVPVLVVTMAFLGIFITSFGVLLQALYLAGDMEFLLCAPIPVRAVFVTKLLQAILPNLGVILLFGLPVLYGLGASAGYTFLYFPLVPLVLFLLALAAAGLASLLVMVVVRFIPARRVAEVLGFVVAIFWLICSQSGQIMNFSNVSSNEVNRVADLLPQLNLEWSPLTWAGRSLLYIGEGRWLAGIALTVLTIGLTAAIFAVSLQVAERLYLSGWSSVQVGTRKKKTARAARPARMRDSGWVALLNRFVPSPVRAILTKDFLMLRRDLRSMSQIVTPLILGIVYAFALLRSGGQAPAGRGEAPPIFMDMLQNLMVYANVGIALFVGWSLLSRLAAMGFSQEGKNYWLLKTAPVSTFRLLGAKFLVAYLPTLALCAFFLLILSLVRGTEVLTLLFSLAAVALTIAGGAGLNLAFGVVGANFEWEDPRRISQGSMGCLGALVTFLYLGLSLVLFFGPAVGLVALGLPQIVGNLVGLLVGGAASLAVTIVPLWLVRERVPRLAEE